MAVTAAIIADLTVLHSKRSIISLHAFQAVVYILLPSYFPYALLPLPHRPSLIPAGAQSHPFIALRSIHSKP